jgi:hypothetical protein
MNPSAERVMNPHAAIANPSTASGPIVGRTTPRLVRADRRTPYRIPCRVRLVDADTGEVRTVVGETVNLSPRGVALQLSVDVPLGTWVETLVPHLNGDPLFLCGKVVHSRRTMMANFEIGVETDQATMFV